MGYWIARPYWGLGFATEAGRQLMGIARAMHLPKLTAGHFLDNPASGAVLRKAGFRPTGRIEQVHSLARGREVACHGHAIDLSTSAEEPCPDGPSRKASPDDGRTKLRLAA